jgi:hypothetical protein|tara:strand:+ start:1444 stop:2043 length:600 start_codon:yes stop_codon:yes gene_type:complete
MNTPSSFKIPTSVFWCKFKDYSVHCDALTVQSGATYGFVFNENKPKSYQYPSEFEECVYIGESAGWYIDVQGGSRRKDRSYVHKRMTSHNKTLMNGNTPKNQTHSAIIDSYGYGEDVLNGTLTNKPMWLGLMLPRPDLPKELVKMWVQYHERAQMLDYAMRWGKSPISNKDTESGSTSRQTSQSTKHKNNRIDLYDVAS